MGPKGVHVAHAVIDGVIDIPRTKDWNLGPGGKIDPDAVSGLGLAREKASRREANC